MDYRKEYKGKTILVTGGAGCIGSNLIKALLEAEARDVIVLDDLSASRRWNIKKLEKEYKNLRFWQGNVTDIYSLSGIFEGDLFHNKKVDIVFHLAAHFANQNSIDNPEDDLDTNGLGTLTVLKFAKDYKVERFVYASSGCSVYGSQAPLPLKEDYVSLNLDTPYQIHKLLGELYCNFFYNYYKLPVAIARYFNVFGIGELPGQYRNVIPNFIWRGMHGQPLIITGTGEETRDFTYVGDIVDGTMRLGVMPEAVGEAFNLASGKETKVIDIVNVILILTDLKSKIGYVKQRDWDKITRRRASINKARKVLGYEPKTNITDGIKEVKKWILEHKAEIERDAKF
jgi:UDP-glucose 4-epimerase